jgi:2-keto-4-pentenoate hydratase
MEPALIEATGELLFQLWLEGRRIPRLPAPMQPQTRADGYRIQARLERHSSSRPFGWKIAATSAAGQRHINVDGPLAGRILAERVLDSGGTCLLSGNGMRLAEPEFAFRMRDDLLPRARPYAVAEVLERVGSLHPAVEIPDTRLDEFAHVGAEQLIADNACAHSFALGAASPAIWRTIDLSVHPVSATLLGNPPRHGSGSNVLGDPRVALAWLVNELSRHHTPLLAGQVVTTGTCMVPIPVREQDHLSADFGVLGRVELQFL